MLSSRDVENINFISIAFQYLDDRHDNRKINFFVKNERDFLGKRPIF